MRTFSRWALLLSVPTFIAACDDGNPAAPEPGLVFDPADFVAAVTNPFFPLVPGTTYTYEGETEDESETIVVEVRAERRNILGIQATVVRDRVFVEDELVEDTFDWYAQDRAGNVWYLGEDSREIEDGEVVSTEGSWEAGVDGAEPGIIMWADPAAHIGEAYRQEFYEGEAEDWGRVVAVDQAVSVPFGDFEGCVLTEDWDALEPEVLENKHYCPGIGVTLEETVRGDEERVELVDVEA